jgi:hypothetical protein
LNSVVVADFSPCKSFVDNQSGRTKSIFEKKMQAASTEPFLFPVWVGVSLMSRTGAVFLLLLLLAPLSDDHLACSLVGRSWASKKKDNDQVEADVELQ